MCLSANYNIGLGNVDELIDKALRNIYAKKYGGAFDENLWKITTGQLNKAVDEVYGKLEFDTPEKLFANQLKYSNSLYSAFKSQHQTNTLKHLRIASKAKSFSDFKNHPEVKKVVNDYNKQWLKTEYATAKQRIRSAQQYRQAVLNSDLYPNIEYMPSRATDPREAHKPYYGTILPINHAFWNTHLPPFDWGCQCWWQTTDATPTKEPELGDAPQPKPGLDENPGKTGQVFSATHPFFKAKNKEAAMQNVAYINQRRVDEFTVFEWDKKTGGVAYSFHKSALTELKSNQGVAGHLMRRGYDVELLSNPPKIKSVDARVNGILAEFKQAKTAQSVDDGLRRANRQGKATGQKITVFVELTQPVPHTELHRVLRTRLRRTEHIQQAYVLDNEVLYLFENTKGLTEVSP